MIPLLLSLFLIGFVLAVIHRRLVPLQNLPRMMQIEWDIWRIDRRSAALAREKEEHLAAIKAERMRKWRAQPPPNEKDDL